MTLAEILGVSGGAGFIIILLGLIKVEPLKISVWGWLARKLGKSFNGELFDAIRELRDDFDGHLKEHEQAQKDREEDKALTNRQRILRFADEMYDQRYHSKEYFEDMLEKIAEYDDYCATHPGFQNGRTVAASRIIKTQYEECFRKHNFSEE